MSQDLEQIRQDKEDMEENLIEEFAVEEGEKAAKDGIKYVGREDARQIKEKEAAVPKSEFGKEFSPKDFKFV